MIGAIGKFITKFFIKNDYKQITKGIADYYVILYRLLCNLVQMYE